MKKQATEFVVDVYGAQGGVWLRSLRMRIKSRFDSGEEIAYVEGNHKNKFLSGFNMLAHRPLTFTSFLSLLFRRPKRLQMAALCHRGQGDAKEYLLVTSRDTGRWIIPKGWPIRGLSANETALQEAWEEAGVADGRASDQPIGTYTYDKRFDDGMSEPVETLVYSVAVNEIADEFPEVAERTRKWVRAEDAADMVQEPELKAILRNQ